MAFKLSAKVFDSEEGSCLESFLKKVHRLVPSGLSVVPRCNAPSALKCEGLYFW